MYRQCGFIGSMDRLSVGRLSTAMLHMLIIMYGFSWLLHGFSRRPSPVDDIAPMQVFEAQDDASGHKDRAQLIERLGS